MGWRFQKRIKIAPGVRLNLSRRGVSTTVGIKGASINVGKDGTYANTGLPGTGVSARTRLDKSDGKASTDDARGGSGLAPIAWLVIASVTVAVVILIIL